MPLPTKEELVTKLTTYVEAKSAQQLEFVGDCVDEAIAFILTRVPNVDGTVEVLDGVVVPQAATSPLGDVLYRREVIELGSELYHRRQAKNGVVSVDNLGNPIRVAKDPFAASEARLTRHNPLGFA